MSESILGGLIVVGLLMCLIGFIHGPWWVGLSGSLVTTIAFADQVLRDSKEGPPEDEG